jgi:hypothetical protein
MSQLSLEGIYVAYYGRAADPAGLTYWLGQETAGLTDSAIAMAFVPQTETLALYPALNTPAALQSSPTSQASFINSVYQNLFGHSADAPGLSYWQSQLTAGANPGFMVYQIIIGATGNDATTIANRETVSSSYTNAVIAQTEPPISWNVNTDPAQSRAIIATVNSTAISVTTATGSNGSAGYITQDITNDIGGANPPLLIFNGALAASAVTPSAALSNVQTGGTTGLSFIATGDTTSNTTLTADLNVLNGYVAGSTKVDLAGLTAAGYKVTALTPAQLTGLLGASTLLAAVNGVAAAVNALGASKQVVAFAYGTNEYVYQDKAGASTLSVGDGVLQVTGAAATFKSTDLSLT